MTRRSVWVTAVAAVLSFVTGLWILVRVEAPAQPGGDYNVHLDVTPVSVGLLLAALALLGLHRLARRRAANSAARGDRAERPAD